MLAKGGLQEKYRLVNGIFNQVDLNILYNNRLSKIRLSNYLKEPKSSLCETTRYEFEFLCRIYPFFY